MGEYQLLHFFYGYPGAEPQYEGEIILEERVGFRSGRHRPSPGSCAAPPVRPLTAV